jgi:hypothetical protein
MAYRGGIRQFFYHRFSPGPPAAVPWARPLTFFEDAGACRKMRFRVKTHRAFNMDSL